MWRSSPVPAQSRWDAEPQNFKNWTFEIYTIYTHMVSWNAGTSKSSIFFRRFSIIFHCKPSSDKGVPRPQRLGWVESWWFSVKGCSFLRQVLPWASPRSCFQPAMQRWCDAMCHLQTSLAAGSHMWSLCCCLNDWDKTRWGVFITGRSWRFSGNIFVWATSSKRTCPINSSNSAKIPPHRSVSWIRIRTAGQLLFEASITGHFRNLNCRYLPILEIWAYMVLTYLHFRILKFPLIQGFATFRCHGRSLGRKPSQAMFPHKKRGLHLKFLFADGILPQCISMIIYVYLYLSGNCHCENVSQWWLLNILDDLDGTVQLLVWNTVNTGIITGFTIYQLVQDFFHPRSVKQILASRKRDGYDLVSPKSPRQTTVQWPRISYTCDPQHHGFL